MKAHHIRIVEPARCPQCHGRMAKFTNGQGRGWTRCMDCGAQIPTESGYREVKDGTNKSQGDSGGLEESS